MEHFKKEGISPIVNLEEENGCCYCLVEPDGERSFLSQHGAEYLFNRSWMKNIDFSSVDGIFICGLEVEEPTGDEIVDFVYEHQEPELFFAPGSRINHIPQDRMERLLGRRDKWDRGPFLHLNEIEVQLFSGESTLPEGARFIAQKTGSSVVVTLGKMGCFCLENAQETGFFVPGFPVIVKNTVGAGDAHYGALIAGLWKGKDLKESCGNANRIGAELVSGAGFFASGMRRIDRESSLR
jgi:sugar/nucleoside kinase (ribokinase family)